MRIGFHLTPFWSPTDRPPTPDHRRGDRGRGRRLADGVRVGLDRPALALAPDRVAAAVSDAGRLAPETGAMRLKTSVLLLPILNPVEVAESVATLDHICHGRLDVGVAIGYRELELGDRRPGARRSRGQARRVARRHEARCGAATTVTSPGATRACAGRGSASRRTRRRTRRSRWARRARARRAGPRASPTASSSARSSAGPTSRASPRLPRGARRGERRHARLRRRLAQPHRRCQQGGRRRRPPAPIWRRPSRCTGRGRCRSRPWAACSSASRRAWTTGRSTAHPRTASRPSSGRARSAWSGSASASTACRPT